MAFGTASAIFRAWLSDQLSATIAAGKMNNADVFDAALYGNSGTPDKTAAAASTAYNTGAWITANELTDPNWAAGGRAISGTGSGGGFTSSTNLITWTGSNTSGAGNVTITNAYGDLVYDFTLAAPVAKQGAAFHYFGGPQSVTAGTFTIQWNASGIMQVSV